ncbi:MAG: hypothetical protein ACREQC_09105 [Candidatus Binataceae bacterium]
MESFLNLLWVAIALAALAAWRIHWVHERDDERRNVLRECTAIVCVLVFLFFAVSLTDDLHSELVLFDECAAVRRNASAQITGPHRAPDTPVLLPSPGSAMRTHSVALPSIHTVAVVLSAAEPAPVYLPSDSRPARAPPAAL